MPTPSYAERKLATVLFADLVGHTEILTRIDPEEWQGLLRAYFAEVTERIQKYGGTVEKFIGDAVFAVFGVPRVHEDDAARAVRAALEIQDALLRLAPMFKRRLGTSLGLRIAIATGEVVAPGGEQLVTSEIAALAERLQQQAPPNNIILSERTYHMIAPLVDVQPLGPLALKGFGEEQRAFLVQRLHSPAEKIRGTEVSAPLVGREHELQALLDGRDRLLAGRGQILAIIGDAGLGKSRLIAELRDQLGSEVLCLEAHCYEFTQATTYGVIVEHLRQYLGLAESDPPEIGRVQLRAALYRASESPPEDLRQALESLLGLDASREFEESIRGLRPEEVRARVVHGISTFWEAVVAKRPTLMVVEDFHWVDPASAGALEELLKVTERAPLMLVLAFRTERRSLAWEFKVAAEREYPHQYREVRLEPLTAHNTERLAGLLLENTGLSVSLKEGVAQRAEGNPLYVEEIIQSLRQHSDSPTALIRMPDTLQGVLQARLDSLPPGTKRVLQTASVIGRTFPLKLLSAVSGMNGDLTSHLSVLQRTEFLLEQLQQPERRFAFKHVLLQEAAYQTLLRDERRDFHQRIAEIIERDTAAPELPILFHHFLRAERWDKAFLYGIKAADAARSLSALKDALELYDAALKVARDHPDIALDKSMLLHAQMAYGNVLSFLGHNREAQRYFEELLAHHRTLKMRAPIYRSIGRLNSLTGNMRKAQTYLERALRLFQREEDHEAEAETLRDLALVMERRRDYPKSLEYASRALTIAQEHALRSQMQGIYYVLATTHFFGGSLEKSIQYNEESLRLATENGDQLGVARSQNTHAYFLLLTGDIKGAVRQAGQAMSLATKLGISVPLALTQDTLVDIFVEQGKWKDASAMLGALEDVVQRYALGAAWGAMVHRGRGFLALGQGQWSDALQYLAAARALERQAGLARYLPRTHRGLAEAYLGVGDLARAQIHASKVRVYERGGNPIETPAAERILAVIARERGDPERALKLIEDSLSLMTMRTGSGEYARILLELAKTYAILGRKAQAWEAADQSIRVYTELEATPLVEAARHIAEQF